MKIDLNAELFSVNAAGPDGLPRRTVEGVAVEWNAVATVASGQRVKFLPGSLPTDGPAPKFMLDHNPEKPLGMVTERIDTGDAMLFAARVSVGAAKDEILAMAGPGEYYDSVSVGVEPVDYTFGAVGTPDENVLIVKSGRWMELSLLPFGAFATAKVAQVAAAEPEPEEPTPTDSEEEPEVATQETPAAVEAAVPTNIIYAAAKPEFKMPALNEYVSKFLQGGSAWEQFNANIRAAAPNVVSGDLDGVVPEIWTQPVYNGLIGRRPVIDAIGTKAMPQAGKIFIRPKVTTHTTIGASNGENVALDSGTFVVSDLPVTKGVYGGYVVVSEESMDWSSPEVVGLILDDMGREYAAQTESAVESALWAGMTQAEPLTDATDPEVWIKWVYTCAETILSNSTHLPGHLFVSPDAWKNLGSLADSTGRALFPQVGPMNAYGNLTPGTIAGNAFGLQVVVCPHLSGFYAVGNADGFEIFEQQKGAISAESNNGSLSRTIAWRGYLASLMIDDTKFVTAVLD